MLATAEFFALDDIHILCTKPPRCVLFKRISERKTSFEHLDEGIIPVFPIDRSITINSYSIRRKQVPMCAAFSLTDYKVQGQTFTEAILDLYRCQRKGLSSQVLLSLCSAFTFNLICWLTFTSKIGNVRPERWASSASSC